MDKDKISNRIVKESKHKCLGVIARKGQIISFDFATSLFAFIFVAVVFIAVLIFLYQERQPDAFELEFVFDNLQENLAGSAPTPFFFGYRVDNPSLQAFSASMSGASIDDYVVDSIPGKHGIGLDEASYDTCLYFVDTDGSFLNMAPGVVALGYLGKDSQTCHDKISNSENPCSSYSRAVSFFRPVVLDVHDPALTRIVQMNLVVCKI